MIVRDKYAIIVQHNYKAPNNLNFRDGGDSDARQGIMALMNEEDKVLLSRFIIEGQVVRHPYQERYNDPKETSRDQIVQYFASIKDSDIAYSYAKSWFINKDFLDPSVKLYLWKKSGKKVPLWLKITGTVNMFLSLLWNCFAQPDEEKNQFCCMCIEYGEFWVRFLYKHHPNIEKNINSYWDDWRDQKEIGETLITKMQQILKGEK